MAEGIDQCVEVLDILCDAEDQESDIVEALCDVDVGEEDPDDEPAEEDVEMELNYTDDEGWMDESNMDDILHDAAKRGRPVGWRKDKEEVVILRPRTITKGKRTPIPVENLISFFCCAVICLANIAVENLGKAREKITSMSILEKSRWIMQWLHDHSREEDGTWVFSYMIAGVNVCQTAWLATLDIPRSTFYSILNRFKAGATTLIGPGNIMGRSSSAAYEAMAWLQVFTSNYADKMPNSIQLHLPSCLTKISVYNMYAEKTVEKPVSMSHFLKLWRETMSHVVIPKRSRMSVCDICLKIQRKMTEARSKEDRTRLEEYRRRHLNIQNLERQKYYKHVTKAKNNPDKYLSIIIDAMDQRKTSIPNFHQESKSLSNTYRLKVNLMAALVHGIGVYGFFDCCQWAHGSCFTLSILINTLLMLDTIPDVLYMQMDNCYGQNKNKFTLGLLSKLVEERIFKKVKLSFLIVGHTHEDIDQLFSRFSVWIDHNNVLTLDELIKGFELCYTPRPIGTKTANVYNFHQWLDISSVKNHSKPHVFKITLNENTGKARLLYKNLSTDKEWNVPDGEGDIVTRSGDALMNITPSTEKIDIERLQADLKTVYSFFKAANVKPWWDAYFTELLEEETQDTFETDIITALKNKKAARAHPQEPEDPYIFEDLPDLEQRIPKVLIGKAAKLPKQTESAPRSLTQGDMALSSYDKYPDEFPQLSKVLSVDGDRVSVEWYKGGKTIPWKPATRAVKGGSRGQREPFQEVIPLDSIWLWGFKLTPGGLLPKHVRDQVTNYVL